MIIQGIEVNKGLIIDTPWIDLILDGKNVGKCEALALSIVVTLP
ncbi:hypothetical protein P3538_21240 [Vibrio parahaemolyticus]|nr:hypothetical protein [Vibrio parahaemolyticus]